MKREVNWAHYVAMQAGVVPLSLGIPGVLEDLEYAQNQIAAALSVVAKTLEDD